MRAPPVERRRYYDEAAFATGRQRMLRAGWLVRSIRRKKVGVGRGRGVDGTLENRTSFDASVSIPPEGASAFGSDAGFAMLLGLLGAVAAVATFRFFVAHGLRHVLRRASIREIEVDYVPRRKRLRRRRPPPAATGDPTQ